MAGFRLAQPNCASHETWKQPGDATVALQNAAAKHEAVYKPPAEIHNPIELHATVAV